MDCTLLEQVICVSFALSLLVTNYASWRMQKLAKIEGYKGPQWKLVLGDVVLPKSVLNNSGLLWRKASIVSFAIFVLSAVTIGVPNSNGSQCF